MISNFVLVKLGIFFSFLVELTQENKPRANSEDRLPCHSRIRSDSLMSNICICFDV